MGYKANIISINKQTAKKTYEQNNYFKRIMGLHLFFDPL